MNASTSAIDGGRPVRSRRHAPDERLAIGLRRGRKPSRLERREHEAIDLVDGPAVAAHRRQCGLRRRNERPVRLPLSALLDPASQRAPLDVGERQVGLRAPASSPWGRCCRCGARARSRPASPGTMARRPDSSAPSAASRMSSLSPRLARAVVGAVTLEAAIRQDRADVKVEVHALGHARHVARGRASAPRQRECQYHEQYASHRLPPPYHHQVGTSARTWSTSAGSAAEIRTYHRRRWP